MRSHLVSWEEEYIDEELIIVEINQSAEPLEVMRNMVASQRLNHPVLWDAERRNTKVYGVCDWPFAYFIGADGKVFWEGDPKRWIRREEKIKEMRAMVEWELAWAKKRNAETDQRFLGLLSRPRLPLQVSRMIYRLREQIGKMMSVQNPRRRSRQLQSARKSQYAQIGRKAARLLRSSRAAGTVNLRTTKESGKRVEN